MCRAGYEAYKTRLAYNITIRILAHATFTYITKILEYTVEELNLYALLAMCSLVMSLCSCDLHVMSLK